MKALWGTTPVGIGGEEGLVRFLGSGFVGHGADTVHDVALPHGVIALRVGVGVLGASGGSLVEVRRLGKTGVPVVVADNWSHSTQGIAALEDLPSAGVSGQVDGSDVVVDARV